MYYLYTTEGYGTNALLLVMAIRLMSLCHGVTFPSSLRVEGSHTRGVGFLHFGRNDGATLR